MVFCSFSLGKNQPDFFAFDKQIKIPLCQAVSLCISSPQRIFLLLPRVSDQNIADLAFIVLGKKLLLHLNASSFPECMEQGKNQVLWFPLSCFSVPLYALTHSHTVHTVQSPAQGLLMVFLCCQIRLDFTGSTRISHQGSQEMCSISLDAFWCCYLL